MSNQRQVHRNMELLGLTKETQRGYISGVTFSGTYPILLALTSVLFPHWEGTSLVLLLTMGGFGSIFLC